MAAQLFDIDPSEHTLYKTDWTEDPRQGLKNEKHNMRKEHIRSGDLLVIKHKAEVGIE